MLEISCHHNFELHLPDSIAEAGIGLERDGPLFRSLNRDGSLSDRRPNRHRAREVLRRRALAAGISTDVCDHLFRATGIMAYLGKLEAPVEAAQ